MIDKKPLRKIHLICNAHLDPVWTWEWEEGAAAALSTFRTAADLCEAFDGFIFNHNEVILYRWVEEYEPDLFKRIQRLVKAGKWHIMGGWYLQPDCNMPSGESFIRQILLGRQYFADKFGVRPTTAINFDPFGHTRGLVQIMVKSGYDSYIFCRPGQEDCALENDEFIWEGYDGSRLLAVRPWGHYLSVLGKAHEKVENYLKEKPGADPGILLWGVGDHGGGASHADLEVLAGLIQQRQDVDLLHSTPEAYFADLARHSHTLPVHRKDLKPWAVGCYTSQVRVKQKHRQFENELYTSEKMSAAAWGRGLISYPQAELHEAMIDLAGAEFHDILPGSSIQPVEETSLRLMDHGLEILSRVKARAFFALATGQPKTAEGEIPILVYNPHPYPVKGIVECEFQLADQNYADTFTQVRVYAGDQALPSQVEKEIGNINLDWRKRVAFYAELAPTQMNRFDCHLEIMPQKPKPTLQAENDGYHFMTEEIEVIINTHTGLLDRYRVHGVDCLDKNAFAPLVMLDDPDPWGMRVHSFRHQIGIFELLSSGEGARFSGVNTPGLPSVRVIEEGAVRTVIEAVLGYENSRICLRYKLPRHGTEIEVEVRVHWNEKDRMLKLALPTCDKHARSCGQTAFGVEALPDNGDEGVAQKWVAVLSSDGQQALSIVNDGVYGLDCCYGEVRLSLMRSPAYSGHPILHRPILPDDRYMPRIDQGERLFRFWIKTGPQPERLQVIDREALAHNEKPVALSFFPAGNGSLPQNFLTLSDQIVQVSAVKKAENSQELIIRLYEPSGEPRSTILALPALGMQKEVTLKGYEVRTFCLDLGQKTWREVNLVEENI